MLYTLNLHNVIPQLYLNKAVTGGRGEKHEYWKKQKGWPLLLLVSHFSPLWASVSSFTKWEDNPLQEEMEDQGQKCMPTAQHSVWLMLDS